MRRTLGLVVAAALVLGACGDDEAADDAVDAGEAVASTVADAVDDPTEGTAATDTDDGGEGTDGCAATAEAAAPDQGLESFPDNPDATWTVLGSRTDDDGRAVVEVEPSTPDVGYPGFLFLSECPTDDEAVLLAVYAWEGGTWNILFTTDELGPLELEPTLEP
jgi:hypothetical protein